jgi:hypothetical protein
VFDETNSVSLPNIFYNETRMNTITQGAKIMRNLVYPTLMIITAAALSSCNNAAPANTFAGSYTGTFTVSTGSDNGEVSLTVANDGGISGTITLTSVTTTPKPQAPVAGTIQNDGTLNATYKYSGDANPTFTLKGNMTLKNKVAIGTLNASTPTLADAGKVTLNLTQK